MSKTRVNKAKGRTGQQEVRDKILETFSELSLGDVRSTAMGQGGVDIQLSPKALSLLPISTEVKRRKDLATVYNWYNQADRKDGNEPVVFFRGDRKPWVVFLSLDYYMELAYAMAKNQGQIKEEKGDESLEH